MSESSPRRARLWRYLGYTAGALLVFVLFLVVGSWLAVRVWGPEFARERLETALTSALDRPTRVEHVSVRPWLGRVVIGNVTAGARPGAARLRRPGQRNADPDAWHDSEPAAGSRCDERDRHLAGARARRRKAPRARRAARSRGAHRAHAARRPPSGGYVGEEPCHRR